MPVGWRATSCSFYHGMPVMALTRLGHARLYRTGSLGHGFAIISTGGSLSRSYCCEGIGTSQANGLPMSTGGPLSVRKVKAEKLWRKFFSDPSQWLDHREEKATPKYPDFKHKKTQQGLWLHGSSTPSWVETELAAVTPGTIPSSNFSWNIRLRKYVKAGEYSRTMALFQHMQREGMVPDKFTFVPVLNACSGLSALEEGRRIHLQVIKSGFGRDVVVGTCLVDMYGKCGSIEDARTVFNKLPTRCVVSWNALILGYVKCGQGWEALQLSRQMRQEGVDLDRITFIGVLNACATIGALEEGRRAHEEIVYRGYGSDPHVVSALVDMYAKCGSVDDAHRVFDEIPTKNPVSWNALILSYVKCERPHEALELFRLMLLEGVDLSPVTFLGVLNGCASIGALEEGRCLHEQIIEKGYECYLYVANALIDMYAKCGSIDDARRVFNNMLTRDVVSWNAMLAGYCRHGYVKEAVEHFERMCQEIEVDAMSFVSLLSACSHGGLVDDGMRYFESMSAVFNISPKLEHYVSIIDLLARAGRLHEAEDLIKTMPFEPGTPIWMSLLGACRIHGEVEIGEFVARQVLALDSANAAARVLLLHIHADLAKRDKSPSCSLKGVG